jgi:macrodomain Ter protein organizer (MatP/YcbG family)
MKYRGVEYQVVETPTGWKWTVLMTGRRPRTGEGYNRAAAIAFAQRAIDKLIETSSDPLYSRHDDDAAAP